MKIRTKFIFAALLVIALPAFSQSIHATNVDSLKKYANTWKEKAKKDKVDADLLAETQKFEKKQILENKQFELIRMEKDRPIYHITANLDAAQTLQTAALWPGGSLGLGLNGSGMGIGIWDGGAVRATHQEISGRVTHMDGAASISNHASHVAGTLIASGINPDAKGMAFAAQLQAYDWINDHSEMADAAAEGLLISNHSYTNALGWVYNLRGDGLWAWMGDPTVSTYEDYFFGLYSLSSMQMDQIAHFAPYYLIVRAAGNDRSETGPPAGTPYWLFNNGNFILSTEPRDSDGPYDCIGDDGMAKNILTIGGIEDILDNNYTPANIAARMTVFSNWGPADDGRIKPDLVADGANTFSIFGSGDSDYFTLNGTSSAAPNVAGSVALLQQHYFQSHGSTYFMTSALAKALLICTAHESGANEGPDYCAGWGLANIAGAADLISQDMTFPERLQEGTLLQNAVHSYPLYCSGVEPVKITLAWTDPPGSPVYQLNPATPMLVNDLDLRLTRAADAEVYYPWRLDRSNPSAAATRGDNTIDNVEQISLAAPSQGYYTLSVSHKGTLQTGQQDFALVISGATTSQTYPLAVAIDGQGQVDKTPDLLTYWPNQNVQLTATPQPGWVFSHWNGDLTGNGNPAALLMDGPKSITAVFTASQQPVINTELVYVDNQAGVPASGEGTLTLEISAVATDGVAHPIRDFKGSLLLDANFRIQVIHVAATAPFFPAADYANRLEEYDDDPASFHFGRIYYEYHLTGSNPQLIGATPVAISTITIQYYLSEFRGGISWNEGISDFHVMDTDGIDLTGLEVVPLPGELLDIPLPVELANFSAKMVDQSVQLTWMTHSETENTGFHIYRRADEETAYSRITRAMIPGAGNSSSRQEYGFLDREVTEGKTYSYYLQDIDYKGRATKHAAISITVAVPGAFSLQQNYPNPFNPSTRLTFSLPQAGWTSLTIYNIQGQIVRTLVNGELDAGLHLQEWDGRDEQGQMAPSGIYLYRLIQGAQQQTRKMQLVK